MFASRVSGDVGASSGSVRPASLTPARGPLAQTGELRVRPAANKLTERTVRSYLVATCSPGLEPRDYRQGVVVQTSGSAVCSVLAR